MTNRSSTQSTPTSRTVRNTPPSMNGSSEQVATAALETTPVAKPKRVRTGCLTCRARHLKCDEGLPNCLNCKKSNRKCDRGIRLNFIDIVCERPPYLLPPTADWKVTFHDDSRGIASDYKGGLERYRLLQPSPKRRKLDMPEINYDYNSMAAPVMSHQQLPPQSSFHQTYPETTPSGYAPADTVYQNSSGSLQSYGDQSQAVRANYEQSIMLPPEHDQGPAFLDDRNEALYMKIFIKEVALWMDSMDPDKHFSRLIPFQALREPMLKHAVLACGVRHLSLINPNVPEQHAMNHYNMATELLLKSLTNPERDSALCATTATILNVSEVMSEKLLQRMNHIAGARALIKECRWDATSTGIGAACFWLNVGLELFSCLHFNWGVAWDPDTWGVDMTMNPRHIGGGEEGWCHKMLWILAKVTSFRASVPRFQEQSLHAEQVRFQTRLQQWSTLKQLCDRWEKCIPPTMHPIAYLTSYLSSKKSQFPEVMYVKRATIMARLFYHTAMAILAAVHPLGQVNQQIAEEMSSMRIHHSRQICGIVAHVSDRGVASASIRCLAIAGENLTDRREQEEVIQLLEQIQTEAGWRLSVIPMDLKEKWGWNSEYVPDGRAPSFYQQGAPSMPPVPTPQRQQRPPSGIINPMYKDADFGGQNPPYQGSYVPPTSSHLLHSSQQLYGFAGLSAI